MHSLKLSVTLTLILISTSSCTPAEPLNLADGCNPLLAGLDCMLPYPSDFFRVEDSTTPSGYIISREGAAKLYTKQGASADPDDWQKVDGYSTAPTILARFGQALSTEKLTNVMDEPSLSLSPETSATLIIDTVDQSFVAHYADVDPRVEDLTLQSLSLHPFAPLVPNRRYIVVVQGLKSAEGQDIATPEGFRRIRDDDLKGDKKLEDLAKHYKKDIFPILKSLGINRQVQQLTWDFTTATHEGTTKDFFRIKQLTQEYLTEHGSQIVFEEDIEHPSDPLVWRTITGTLSGPNFIDPENPKKLFRDEAGKVQLSGNREISFIISLPMSLQTAAEPAPIIAYGHGFFGGREELTYSGARHLSQALGSPFIAIDWFGMRTSDRFSILSDISTDMPTATSFIDRIHQGLSHWLVVGHAVKELLWTQTELQDNATGKALYAPENYYYMGISQGHILGGALAVMDENLSRLNFQVGGAGFSSMMFRARPFMSFLFALGLMLENPLAERKLAAVLQHHLDRVDPSTYASYLRETKEARPILMQIALGDVEVPNPSSFFHARAIELPMTGPSPKNVWGIPLVENTTASSALTLFDFAEDTDFYRAAEAPDKLNEVHGNLRLEPAATEQIKTFFSSDGGVIHPCDSVCDPN